MGSWASPLSPEVLGGSRALLSPTGVPWPQPYTAREQTGLVSWEKGPEQGSHISGKFSLTP